MRKLRNSCASCCLTDSSNDRFLHINDIVYNGMIMIILNIIIFHAHYTVLEAKK